MKSSTSRNLVLLILVVATMAATAQTAPQSQTAPEQPAPQQQNAPQQPAPKPAQTVQQPSVSQPQSSTQQNVSSEGQALHILVGKSVVVNVQAPITRVLSSNPSVIETLATSPTEIVVEGRAAGSSSLILWDQSGRSQMLDVVVDVDVAGLRSAIERSYPDQHIDVQADGGRLILTGKVTDPKMIEDLTKMATVYSNQIVNSLSLAVSHDRRVLLEVKFAEVDRTRFSQVGVNLFSTGAGNTLGTTTTGQFGGFGTQHITDIAGPGTHNGPFTSEQTINNVLNIFLFRPDIHFGAVIEALQQKSVLQILAEPNLMAINGHQIRLRQNLQDALLLQCLNYRAKVNVRPEQEDIQHVVNGLLRGKWTIVCTRTSYVSDMLRPEPPELSGRRRAQCVARASGKQIDSHLREPRPVYFCELHLKQHLSIVRNR